MTCRDFPLLYSVQLDGYAEEREQIWLQKHLRSCVGCRQRAAELRSLRSELRGLEAPNNSNARHLEMASQIQAAVHREARLQANYARQRADWLELWRTRIFSQGIGAIVSMAMVVVVATGVFRSSYRALILAQAATEVILEETDSDEIRLKVMLLQPPPPPVFIPSGELLGVGASLSENDEIIATVKVRKDGRASVNQIVALPRDPGVVTRFSNLIKQKASFQPARRDQNTSAEAVVIFSKINIIG